MIVCAIKNPWLGDIHWICHCNVIHITVQPIRMTDEVYCEVLDRYHIFVIGKPHDLVPALQIAADNGIFYPQVFKYIFNFAVHCIGNYHWYINIGS